MLRVMYIHHLPGDVMLTLMKSHRARDTVILLTEINTRVHLPEMWPPNSPDLNPVDYSVWGILQKRVYYQQVYDVKMLKEHLLREWRLLACFVRFIDTGFRIFY